MIHPLSPIIKKKDMPKKAAHLNLRQHSNRIRQLATCRVIILRSPLNYLNYTQQSLKTLTDKGEEGLTEIGI